MSVSLATGASAGSDPAGGGSGSSPATRRSGVAYAAVKRARCFGVNILWLP